MQHVLLTLAVLSLAAASSDEELTVRIAERLRAQKTVGQLQQFEIRLLVRDGTVYLSGNVLTLRQEQLAVDIARQTEGVRLIFNNIQVRELTQRALPAITQNANVHDDLPPAPTPDSLRDLLNPAATQIAFAPTWPDIQADVEREENRHLPQHNQGLSQVSLEPSGQPDQARQITTEIIRRIGAAQAGGHLQQFGIDVQCERQIVWMRGQVSARQQAGLVLDIASGVPGVKQVINDLQVQGLNPSNTKDSHARRIARQLSRRIRQEQIRGNLHDFRIDVQCEQGTIRLQGQVSSKEQRRLIFDIASEIPGVRHVVNDVQVRAGTLLTSTAQTTNTSDSSVRQIPTRLMRRFRPE